MADVFLSYAREDLETAQRVVTALEGEGWSVFWDRRIPPGLLFEEHLEQEIEKCRAVVVLWSPHSVASEWVKIEAAHGRELGILIPAIITPTPLPFGYRHLHAADLTALRVAESGFEFQDLFLAIQRVAPRAARISIQDDVAQNPPTSSSRIPTPEEVGTPGPISSVNREENRAAYKKERQSAYKELWKRIAQAHAIFEATSVDLVAVSTRMENIEREVKAYFLNNGLYVDDEDRDVALRYLQYLRMMRVGGKAPGDVQLEAHSKGKIPHADVVIERAVDVNRKMLIAKIRRELSEE